MGRFTVLVLLVALFSIPFGLLLVQKADLEALEAEIALEKIADREEGRLDSIQRSLNLRMQLLTVLGSFTRHLETIWNECDLGAALAFARKTFRSKFAPRLPSLELVLVEVASSGSVIRFQGGPGSVLADPGALRLMARWACGRDEGAQAVAGAVSRMFRFPFGCTPLSRDFNRGEVRNIFREGFPKHSPSGSAGEGLHYHIFWDVLEKFPSRRKLFVLALLESASTPKVFQPQTILDDWKEERGTLVFLGTGSEIIASPSLIFRSRPELERDLRRLSSRKGNEGPRSLRVLDDHLVFFGPELPGQDWRVASMFPVSPAVGPNTSKGAVLLSALAGAWCLGFVFLVERFWFRRGPRLSVSLSLSATFLLVALLPLLGSVSPGRRLIADTERTERRNQGVELDEDLQRLDSNIRFFHQDLVQKMKSVTNATDVLRSLDRIDLDVSENPFPAPEESAKRKIHLSGILGSMAKSFLDGIETPSSVLSLLVTGREGVEGSWSNIRKEQDRANLEQNQRNPIHPITRELVHDVAPKAMPPLPRRDSGKSETRMEGHVQEVFIKVLKENLGGTAFSRFLHYPGGVTQLDFEASKLILMNVAIPARTVPRFILNWTWGEGTIEPPYLKRELAATAPVTFAVSYSGLEKRGTVQLESIPEGIEGIPVLRDLVFRPRYLHGSWQEYVEADHAWYQALKGEFSPGHILAGFRSTEPQLARARSRWRSFLWVMAAMLVLALMVARQSVRFFLFPLERLIGGLKKVNAGDFGGNLASEGADEFAALSGAFNFMTRKLREGEILGQYVSSFVQRALQDENFQREALAGRKAELTVLFSGLVGFDEFEERASPEEIFESIERHLEAFDGAIRSFGGEIDKVMGDKILVVFSHEVFGSGEKAVEAALRVVRAVRAAFSGMGPLPPAMGINSGEAIVGILGAKTFRQEFTAIGDTVNLAARLAILAQVTPGTRVVISGSTLSMAPEGLRTEKLPFRRVKGKTQEVEAHLLIEEA